MGKEEKYGKNKSIIINQETPQIEREGIEITKTYTRNSRVDEK